MRLPLRRAAALAFFCAACCVPSIVAAQLPRERVHPEVVDSTWGRRTQAAWQLAWARQWSDAHAAFDVLHHQHPDAVEPLLGLAFVDRATWRYASARRWYARAFAVEPSEDVRRQLEAAQWDRPARIDVVGAQTDVEGDWVTDWGVDAVLPVDRWWSLTGRIGELGAGNPQLGLFVDSTANGGTPTKMFSVGAVLRPTERQTVAGRFEQWTSNGDRARLAWLDGSSRVSDWIGLHALVRLVNGDSGVARLGGAVDLRTQRTNVVTLELWEGVRDAAFESRSTIHVIDIYTPDVRWLLRADGIFDVGDTNRATTAVLSANWLATPYYGFRALASRRSGVFPRNSFALGAILQW